MKAIEYYIKDITLKELIETGKLSKIIQELENSGIKIRVASILLDPILEPGLIRLNHQTSEEAEKGGLRINFDPVINETTIDIVINNIINIINEGYKDENK